MDKLTKNEYKLLHRLISFNQQEVKKFMLAYLRKHYSKVAERDGFILAEGISPICVIAHLDTVFDYQFTQKNLYYDKELVKKGAIVVGSLALLLTLALDKLINRKQVNKNGEKNLCCNCNI